MFLAKSGSAEPPNRARRNLLVLASTFPRWANDSQPRFIYDLCRQLASTFNVQVLAPHAPGAARHEMLDGIEVTRFRYFITPWQSLAAYGGGILTRLRRNPLMIIQAPLFLLAEILVIRRLLKGGKFDLVHAHWIIPQGFAAAVAGIGLARVPPLLCTGHGADVYGLRNALFAHLKRWVLRRSQAITVVSSAMRDEVNRIAARPPRVEVIPMGTDLIGRFCPNPKIQRHSESLLFVGRLVEKKGVRYLIEALSQVRQSHPDVNLIIAGSGPDESELRDLSARLGLNGCVRFIGPVQHEDLPVLYQQASMIIVPSIIARGGDQEGFGLVIVEALGCCCPVIASDLPAVRDTVRDEITGLLARQRDAAHLAERIAYLLGNPGLRERLGRKGRDYVMEHYDWQPIARRYGELIERLVDSKSHL